MVCWASSSFILLMCFSSCTEREGLALLAREFLWHPDLFRTLAKQCIFYPEQRFPGYPAGSPALEGFPAPCAACWNSLQLGNWWGHWEVRERRPQSRPRHLGVPYSCLISQYLGLKHRLLLGTMKFLRLSQQWNYWKNTEKAQQYLLCLFCCLRPPLEH